MTRRLVVKVTCGAEAAERANQGLTVAAMGLAAGAEVGLWLTGDAVFFAVPDRQPDLALPHATPVADLMAALLAGARVTVCSQCAARRELTGEDLFPGVSIAGAAAFVEVALQPDAQALVY